MKKIYLVVVLILVIYTSIITIKLFEDKDHCDNRTYTFYNEGDQHINKFYSYIDNGHLYSTNPNYPKSINEIGIIRNDSMAYDLASLIITNIYGKECFQKERPARISLINDSIWCVSGTLPEGGNGGTYSILIEKFSGRILKITHGK